MTDLLHQKPSPGAHPVLKHPGRWIWLPLLVPIALGLVRLRFDVEVFDLLPADLPAVQGLKIYEEHFANARELIITLKSAAAEQSEAAARAVAERLARQTDLVASVTWEPPWLEHPDQLAELLAYLWFNQPPAVFQEIIQRLAPGQLAATLSATREQLATSLSPEAIGRLSYDPFGLTRLPGNAAGAAPSFGPAQGQQLFSSPDGKFRVVFVRARSELRSYRDCEQWLKVIQPLAETAAASATAGTHSVILGYTGRPAVVADTAAGMQHDIVTSVGGTAAIIAVLFWLAHRRIKPMLWLLLLLALVLGSTLALGGLIFGKINIVSMGFAAILLGLAVDYAVVHYQEALAHPHLSISQIRHAIAPSIFWAALTTITAFLVLNFGGLPGLGQLGTLVGLGVALAATIMIFEFLPPLFPERKEPRPEAAAPGGTSRPPQRSRPKLVLGFTFGLAALALALLAALGWPPIDATANALRPRRSPAYAALDQIQANLGQKGQPLWLILSGKTVTEVARQLDAVQATMGRAVTNHLVASFVLPSPLWPRPEFQSQNRAAAVKLSQEGPDLKKAAAAQGFAPSSLSLTEGMLDTWKRAGSSRGVFWPTNQISRWLFEKAIARTPTNYYAFGLITPQTNAPGGLNAQVKALRAQLPKTGVMLSGWELLGHAIFSRVKSNLVKVVAPMIILVLFSLWFAFRRPTEILLSLGALVLSGLCLLTVMRLAGWSWNLLSLMAIPLVLGTGVDYSIFMQLALRRYHGNMQLAYDSVGRALLLCGGTAIAAFGSLAWSSNAGMASLGEVCAVGIAWNVSIAIFLAPVWWQVLLGPLQPPAL